MRKHRIISMAAWVAGFVQEKDSDYWRTLRQLLSYDPDQIQALYATPHSWTPFALQVGKHRVVQTDLSRWDYKHQVLESTHVPNWRVLLWVKLIETMCQLRPKSLFRLLAHPDQSFRSGMRWYSNIGRRVWPYEIWQWLFFDRRTRHGPTLAEFLKGGWKVKRTGLSARQPAAPRRERTAITPSRPAAVSQSWPLTRDSLSSARINVSDSRLISCEECGPNAALPPGESRRFRKPGWPRRRQAATTPFVPFPTINQVIKSPS